MNQRPTAECPDVRSANAFDRLADLFADKVGLVTKFVWIRIRALSEPSAVNLNGVSLVSNETKHSTTNRIRPPKAINSHDRFVVEGNGN